MFTKAEGSKCLQKRRGPNLQFYQSGGVRFLSIRRGPNFVNPEGSQFCQSGGVQFLSKLKKTTE